jgi:hypothetical protein
MEKIPTKRASWFMKAAHITVPLPVGILPITAFFTTPFIQLCSGIVLDWMDTRSIHRDWLIGFASQPGVGPYARLLLKEDYLGLPGMLGIVLLFTTPLLVHLAISLVCLKTKRATRSQEIVSIICAFIATLFGFLYFISG